MDGVLLVNGSFIKKDTQYHVDFFKRILNYDINKNISQELLINEFFFRGYIVFIDGENNLYGGIKDASLDTVIFPFIEGISVNQKKYLSNNIHKFSNKHQYLINNLYIDNGLKPLSDIYLKNDCLDCQFFEKNQNFKLSIIDTKPEQCINCIKKQEKNEYLFKIINILNNKINNIFYK